MHQHIGDLFDPSHVAQLSFAFPILTASLMDGSSGECERKHGLSEGDESLELRINREKEPLFRRVVLELALSRPEPLAVYDALHEALNV